jgi:hypothetical protein
MNTEEKQEITDWLDNTNRTIDEGRTIAKKHIKNRHLLKVIDKGDDKAMRLLTYHLERRLNKVLEDEANAADMEYFAQEAEKQAEEKKAETPKAPADDKPEEKPKPKADGLTVEPPMRHLPQDAVKTANATDPEAKKKRAGELSLQMAVAHSDMRKAKTDAERFELGATIVTLDNERRDIWNELEGKGQAKPKPDRIPSGPEKLAEIIRKGSYKTTKDSLSRAKKKVKEATTDRAKKSAQKSVDKYKAELAEIERLMGIGNGKAES